jgi:hypothetical protein
LRAVFTSGGPFRLTDDLVWAGTLLGQADEARLRLGCAGVFLSPKSHADSSRDSSSNATQNIMDRLGLLARTAGGPVPNTPQNRNGFEHLLKGRCRIPVLLRSAGKSAVPGL